MISLPAAITVAFRGSSIMDQSNHEVAIDLLLDRLVARALSELEKLRYSRRSLRRYRTIWRHLVAFSRQMNWKMSTRRIWPHAFRTRIGCVTANASSQANGGDATLCSASRCLETLRVRGALSAPASICKASRCRRHEEATARVRTVLQGSPSSSTDDASRADARDRRIRGFPAIKEYHDRWIKCSRPISPPSLRPGIV